MNRSLQIRAAICVAVLLLSVYLLYPTYKAWSFSDADRAAAQNDPELKAAIDAAKERAIRLGLDLQGGMYLVLEVETEGMDPAAAEDARARVREILANRVNEFGVSEPVIQLEGERRIIIQLPGLQDPERAKELIGATARLEFRLLTSPEVARDAVVSLDEAFQGWDFAGGAEVDAAETAPADTAAAVDVVGGELLDIGAEPDTLAAAGDTAAADTTDEETPFDDLPVADDLLAGDEAASERDAVLAEYPFSGLLMWIEPYFVVAQQDVPRLEDMLEAPEARNLPADVEFQLGMDLHQLGDGQFVRRLYPVRTRVEVEGAHLTSARARPHPNEPGRWIVDFELDRRGTRLFGDLTTRNQGEYLAISMDGEIKSAPQIRTPITQGSGMIESFTSEEAADLALLLRAGALPADVRIAQERTVGPSLGSDSISQGLQAMMWGSILVMVFMLIYYRGSGVITDIALVSNILILMAVLAQFGLVLTLPGIAGVILTVGMAVDANVLINERVREELRKAKTVRAAIQSGYQNATRTILDANVTTLIVGMVLWNFGTGPVLGFAVTLCIGILTSMFTALVLTRVIMEWVNRNRGHQKISV